MVSKASDDFPDPLTPVTMTSLPEGKVTSTFFRLCVRAPRTTRGPRAGGLLLNVPTVSYFRETVSRKCYYLGSRGTKQNGHARAVYSHFRFGRCRTGLASRRSPLDVSNRSERRRDGRPERIRRQEVC